MRLRFKKAWKIASLLTATILFAGLPAFAKMTIIDEVGDKKIKLQIYGFSQFELRGGDGMSSGGDPFFKAQRVRVGFNYFQGPIAGKLFLDFNQSHSSDEGGLPKMIKDGFVAYRFSNAAFVRLGMIKTPLGMSFTIPGWNLDNFERNGLDKGMVLERDFGFMVSGRLIGQENHPKDKWMKTNGLEMGTERQGYGFGYDIGVFNPAGRSSAVVWDKGVVGDALAYVGRVHYDHGKKLHLEAAYGISEQAGGVDTEDYNVFDLGVASEFGAWEFKAEYISGANIRGVTDHDQDCLSLTAGRMVTDTVQALVKHYQASADHPTNGDSKLGNTYLGVNIYLSPVRLKARDLQRHKLVLNYILTSGDDDGAWTGRWGYQTSGYALQWQYKY